MKIIFIEAVQTYGGAQIAIMDLACRLNAHGHEVHMVDCYGTCNAYVEQASQRGLPLHIIVHNDKPYVIKRYNSRIRNGFRLIGYVPHWLRLKRGVKKILSELAPDMVVCYNHKVLSLLDKSPNYKIAYYAHGWYLPQQIPKLMRSLILIKSDRVIAISQATRMALHASAIASLENISVVHNAIDIDKLPTAEAQIPDSEGCFKVLVCGGFLKDKGLHIAIKVAKELIDRKFPIKLIITGVIYENEESVQYSAYIDKLVEELDLSKYVHIVRNKSNVMEYFRACDCLIHPSSTEGLPLVVMEAMAMSKPVVVNAVGGVTDMVIDGYTGVIAPHNNVKFYADAIERIANNAEYRNFMVDNACSMIERTFDTKTQISQFEQVLDSL